MVMFVPAPVAFLDPVVKRLSTNAVLRPVPMVVHARTPSMVIHACVRPVFPARDVRQRRMNVPPHHAEMGALAKIKSIPSRAHVRRDTVANSVRPKSMSVLLHHACMEVRALTKSMGSLVFVSAGFQDCVAKQRFLNVDQLPV